MEESTREFMGRLRNLAEALGYKSLQQFQVGLGFSNSYFRNIGKINAEAEARIRRKHPNVNVDYLREGTGGPLTSADISLSEDSLSEVSYVPLLPISAFGGNLDGFEPSVCEYECEMIVSPIKNAGMAITISGDSMSPEYPNGCIVFIRKIDETAFIEWGRTYVLDTINGIIMKNVHPCEASEDKIICRSINPNYAEFPVSKKHIRGWYRVLCQMARK